MTLGKNMMLAALLVVTPGWVGAWRAFNRNEVFPISDSVFEVVSRVGSGPADYWCGAGDFVRNALGRAAVTRVYIWRAIGPSVTRPGRKAVQYSLSPPANASTSPGYSLSVKAVGDNMTAAAAYQFCLNGENLNPFWPFN